MPDPLPIVLMHYGNSSYLPYTLGQARLSSLSSPLLLIGDSNNSRLPLVRHFDMNAYSKQAVAFQNIYQHLSPNGHPYELFCFIRWFILRDFMLDNRLSRIIHLDSDVLLYADVNEECNMWADYDLTLVRSVCAGNMFVNGTRSLEKLCDLIWDMYASPSAAGDLRALYDKKKLEGCGISDMDALQKLCDQYPSRIGEMTGIRADNSYWDANIHLSEGFETAGGRKLITFANNRPYSHHLETGRDVRFKSLHFQGQAKNYIEPAFRQGCATMHARAAA